MNRLFARIYLDEDVDVLVADLLQAREFHALTTRDAERLGENDAAQLEFAANANMALVTHNRADFEALHQRWLADGQGHWGILIATRRRPHAVTANLLRLLDRLTADDLRDQLLYL